MVHLVLHIMDDIIQLGPMFLRSMMSFERMNGHIKGFVRNRSRPNGSIAKGFLTKECISFYTNYLDNKNPIGLLGNRPLGRLDGSHHREGHHEMHVDFDGRHVDFDWENLVMLQHIEVFDSWVQKHKLFTEKKYSDRSQQRTQGEIIEEHKSDFTHWFRETFLDNPPNRILLLWRKTSYSPYHREPCTTADLSGVRHQWLHILHRGKWQQVWLSELRGNIGILQ